MEAAIADYCRVDYCRADMYDSTWANALQAFENQPLCSSTPDSRVDYCRADVFNTVWEDMVKAFQNQTANRSISDYCRVGVEPGEGPAIYGEGRYGRCYYGVDDTPASNRADVYVGLLNEIKKGFEK